MNTYVKLTLPRWLSYNRIRSVDNFTDDTAFISSASIFVVMWLLVADAAVSITKAKAKGEAEWNDGYWCWAQTVQLSA